MTAEQLLLELTLLKEEYGSLENIDISVWKNHELYEITKIDVIEDDGNTVLHSLQLNVYE
jgi:hypothetical protein